MSKWSQWLTFVGIACLIAPAAGCLAQSGPNGDELVEEDETAVSGSPGNERIVTNGLNTSALMNEAHLLTNLIQAPLTGEALRQSPLFGTAGGRELLGYVVKCAIGWDDSIHVFQSNREYIFEGGIGLVNGWKDGPLSVSDRRWLSACLLAHANAFDVEVPLSLRGPHPALATDAVELAEFPVQEGAFFGDIFENAGAGVGYACAGPSQHDACQLQANTWLMERVCARDAVNSTECGIAWAGDCYANTAQPNDAGACNAVGDDGYPACHSAGGASQGVPGPEEFAEVITVYLKPAPDGRCN